MKLLLFSALLALALAPAQAQVPSTHAGLGTPVPPVTYVGPEDAVGIGAFAWYGLYGYNAAYATGSNYGVTVKRLSDSTTSNILILNTGALDIATAISFAGTDATCTGTAAASTTLALSSCSSTPNVGSSVTSTGGTGSFVQPVYITAVGSFTSGSGNVTLSSAQTVTAVAVTARYGLQITKWNDQTGNGHDATAGNGQYLFANCIGTSPCAHIVAGTPFDNATISAQSQPMTWTFVAERANNFTAFQSPFGTYNSGGAILEFNNATNQGRMYAGSQFTFSLTNSVWHAVTGVFNNASSVVNADGTETTGTSGTSGTTTTITIGNVPAETNSFYGYFGEAGIWLSSLSSANRTALCRNEQLRYGASNFGATC